MSDDTERAPESPDIVDNAADGRFEIHVDGQVGFIDYHRKGDVLVLTHTELPESLRGQGHAGRLVRGALDRLRERGQKVIPLCPYVSSFIERHPHYRDLVVPRFLNLLDR